MRTLIRLTVLALVACGALACGDSPTGPTPPTPPPPVNADATLSVLVMGHVSNRALSGVAVTLRPAAGGGTNDATARTTGGDGIASWRVVSGQRYSVLVRGNVAITDALLQSDVQWLVSLPE